MSSPGSHVHTEFPAVDERLIAPETGYEIDDGRLVHVPTSDEKHGVNQCAVGALLRAHRSDAHEVATDMLTRTSERDDFAPDASVYPIARDPLTGGRQLEELAFEMLATERLGHAGTKAAKLAARGVRRVFAVDVVKHRAFEWSRELGTWEMLAETARIEDAALVVPLPVAALVNAAASDQATVQAYRARRHPEFVAERDEGRAEGYTQARKDILRHLLSNKFGAVEPQLEARIVDATPALLDRYLARILNAASAAAVFED